MLRMLIVVLMVCLGAASASAEEKKKVEYHDTPEHFENQIKPLIAGIGKAKLTAVYEGLPHQLWEADALEKELKGKKTVQLHKYPFYAEAITVMAEDSRKLAFLCADLKNFKQWGGPKLCGGYHPDWCVEFRNGEDVYRVLICFGCHEAEVFGPKNAGTTDLEKEALKQLTAVLTPLQKNRPKPKLDE